jgi:hypothetical protein
MQSPMTDGDAPGVGVTGTVFQEGYELWRSGCDIWLAYLSDLPAVRTPVGLMEANAKLVGRCMEISGLATGALLKDAGLKSPILNDS